jgi:rSAM/selenodomain-associated transferase 1
MSRCPIVVMAKAPVAGLAKTRLIPALGEAGAAKLAARLLGRAVDAALLATLGAVDLCCTPDSGDPSFGPVAARSGVSLSNQGEGDLGARMERALNRWLSLQGRVLLIGTDAPSLDAAVLRTAALALDDHEAVFVPAFDGGYVLVGLRRSGAPIFSDMTWSTSMVMACTRDRLVRAGWRHLELAAVADIDEPADLRWLPPEPWV